MSSPLHTLHNPIVQSSDPDIKYSPSFEKATLLTQPECPTRVLMRSPLDTLHNPIVLSADPDAKYSSSGEKTTLLTKPEWP